jgi:hypothetical protein
MTHPRDGNIRNGAVFTYRRPKAVATRVLRLAFVAAAAALMAGCAADPRRESGLAWVTEQAEERARLEAMGFPQFTGPN